jgi:hypothetical protein
MERADYSDIATQAQSKQLMRFLLAHQLGGTPIKTRARLRRRSLARSRLVGTRNPPGPKREHVERPEGC